MERKRARRESRRRARLKRTKKGFSLRSLVVKPKLNPPCQRISLLPAPRTDGAVAYPTPATHDTAADPPSLSLHQKMGASSSSPSSAPAQAAADDLQSALSTIVDGVVMSTIVTIQKAALVCTLRCCDYATSPADLAACSSRCDAPVQAAQAVLQHHVGDFQQRLGRAAQACADKARGSLPSSPSEADAASARQKMDACVAAAAREFKGELPRVAKRVSEDAPKAAAAAVK